MIKCQYCGNKYAEGTKYCLGCGRVIEQQDTNNDKLTIELFNGSANAKINKQWDFEFNWLSRILVKLLTRFNHNKFNRELLINKYFANPNEGCPRCGIDEKYRGRLIGNRLSITDLGSDYRKAKLKCSGCGWKHELTEAEEETYNSLKIDMTVKPFPMVTIYR